MGTAARVLGRSNSCGQGRRCSKALDLAFALGVGLDAPPVLGKPRFRGDAHQVALVDWSLGSFRPHALDAPLASCCEALLPGCKSLAGTSVFARAEGLRKACRGPRPWKPSGRPRDPPGVPRVPASVHSPMFDGSGV